jgi:hypothetical protein
MDTKERKHFHRFNSNPAEHFKEHPERLIKVIASKDSQDIAH